MRFALSDVIEADRYPLASDEFRRQCKQLLDVQGALVLENFLMPEAIESIKASGEKQQHLAFYTVSDHNIFLTPADPDYAPEHVRNRLVSSSKGCITDDQVPSESALRVLYDSSEFRNFLCSIFDERNLYEYADPLSSINLHYAGEGQELGWHFDNSSFAVTLMIQEPLDGGEFEYVKDVRDADAGDMNFELCEKVLDGNVTTRKLSMSAGALVLFRGRNSMHRVTPTSGKRTRMLAVLAYNTEPHVSLSESARMTFYGRLG